MRAVVDKWSIVIAGYWNRMIFSSPWVAQHLHGGGPVEIEVPLNNPMEPPRFTIGNVRFVVTPQRAIFTPTTLAREAVERTEAVALTVLQLLPHTPMSAIGVNFQFIEEHPPEPLLGLFRFADDARLTDLGLRAVKRSTHRQLEQDGTTLNFGMAQEEAGVLFEFNFHRDVREPEVAREYLRGRVAACRAIAQRIITAYDLELEQEAQNG
jgi:hypothetical protein